MSNTVSIQTHVHPQIRDKIETLARQKGISTSEYVRNLLFKDIEAKSLVDDLAISGSGITSYGRRGLN